jgi:prepilin-type N-terminal cleavage/methylation domain-containing protein
MMANDMISKPFRLSKDSSGFTLIELILVMVLLGLSAVMVTPFVGQVLSNLLESRELNQRENQAILALQRFVQDVQGASTLTFDDKSPLKCVVDGDSWEIAVDEGVLKLNKQLLAKYLDAGSGFEKTKKSLKNTELYKYKMTLAILMPDGSSFEMSSFVMRKEP